MDKFDYLQSIKFKKTNSLILHLINGNVLKNSDMLDYWFDQEVDELEKNPDVFVSVNRMKKLGSATINTYNPNLLFFILTRRFQSF